MTSLEGLISKDPIYLLTDTFAIKTSTVVFLFELHRYSVLRKWGKEKQKQIYTYIHTHAKHASTESQRHREIDRERQKVRFV